MPETPEHCRSGSWPGWLYKADKLCGDVATRRRGLDKLFDKLDSMMSSGSFIEVNNLLSLDPQYMHVRTILAFLTMCKPKPEHVELLPNRPRFRREAEEHLKSTNQWEKGLLDGL